MESVYVVTQDAEGKFDAGFDEIENVTEEVNFINNELAELESGKISAIRKYYDNDKGRMVIARGPVNAKVEMMNWLTGQ